MSPYVLLGVGYITDETFALPNCILRNQLMRSCVSSICFVFFFTVVVIKFHAHPIKGQRPHTELRLCVHSPLCEWIFVLFCFLLFVFFSISFHWLCFTWTIGLGRMPNKQHSVATAAKCFIAFASNTLLLFICLSFELKNKSKELKWCMRAVAWRRRRLLQQQQEFNSLVSFCCRLNRSVSCTIPIMDFYTKRKLCSIQLNTCKLHLRGNTHICWVSVEHA